VDAGICGFVDAGICGFGDLVIRALKLGHQNPRIHKSPNNQIPKSPNPQITNQPTLSKPMPLGLQLPKCPALSFLIQ